MEPYKPYGNSQNRRSASQCSSCQNSISNDKTNSSCRDRMDNGRMNRERQCRSSISNNRNSQYNSGCSNMGNNRRNDTGMYKSWDSSPSYGSRSQSVRRECSNDDCRDNNPHMKHMPLGMAYVPMQQWGELYNPETALCQGTAFPDLNLIFCGARGKM